MLIILYYIIQVLSSLNIVYHNSQQYINMFKGIHYPFEISIILAIDIIYITITT